MPALPLFSYKTLHYYRAQLFTDPSTKFSACHLADALGQPSLQDGARWGLPSATGIWILPVFHWKGGKRLVFDFRHQASSMGWESKREKVHKFPSLPSWKPCTNCRGAGWGASCLAFRTRGEGTTPMRSSPSAHRTSLRWYPQTHQEPHKNISTPQKC